jgi:hypothetical protein
VIPAPPPLTRTGYLLTVRRLDGSILKTTEAEDELRAHMIAELWVKQLRCTVTSEPPIAGLGASKNTPRRYAGREPRDFKHPCE